MQDTIEAEPKISKEEFFKDVRHEIEMLRLHATDKEKENLNFFGFNPVRPRRCVYGQLTGDCQSKRAKELMDLACIRLMNFEKGVDDDDTNFDYESSNFRINGSYEPTKTWLLEVNDNSYIRNW